MSLPFDTGTPNDRESRMISHDRRGSNIGGFGRDWMRGAAALSPPVSMSSNIGDKMQLPSAMITKRDAPKDPERSPESGPRTDSSGERFSGDRYSGDASKHAPLGRSPSKMPATMPGSPSRKDKKSPILQGAPSGSPSMAASKEAPLGLSPSKLPIKGSSSGEWKLA